MILKNKKLILFLVISLGVFGISCAKTYAQSYEWFMYHDRVDGGGSQDSGSGSKETGGENGGGSQSGSQYSGGGGISTTVYEEQVKKAAEAAKKAAEEAAKKAAEEAAKKAAEEAAKKAAEEAKKAAEEAAKKAAEEAAQRAKAAEDAAAEAQKELTKIDNQIDFLKKEIEKKEEELKVEKETKPVLDFSIFLKGVKNLGDKKKLSAGASIEETSKELLSDIEKERKKLELELDKAKKEKLELEQKIEREKVKEKFAEMSEAYEELADEYAKLTEAGDPVQVGTGNFIAEYTDFEAQDFRNKFKVQRNRVEEKWDGSFGKNWNCELDTRILRTTPYVDEYFYNELKSISYEIEVAEHEYIKRYYYEHEEFPNNEIYAEDLYLQGVNNLIYAELEYLDYQKARSDEIDEKNKYAAYGKYENTELLNSDLDILIFVCKNGQDYKLFKGEDGKWRVPGKEGCESFYLRELDGGGYEVVFSDGSRSYYDEYGILSIDLELNGNQIKYESTNGKISKIIIKTGECITVSRNVEGKITGFEGPVSGKTEYQYQNGRICSVTDNNGIQVGYKYDIDGYLTEIQKADGKKISIGYEYNREKGKKVCTRVTNENGLVETFSYDFENGLVNHKTVSGVQEIFHLNKKGITIAYEDGKGNLIETEVDDTGKILQSVKSGVKRRYEYDENKRLKAVYYQDGSFESLKYNQYGQLVEFKDRDGFSKSYTYNEEGNVTQIYYCGNLITSISYKTNGLVSAISEKGITYNYEYNRFGSVTKKKWRDTDGKLYEELWEYDSLNRVKREIGVDGVEKTYSYGNLKKTTVIANLKQTDVIYNVRNWPVKITQKDLQSNKNLEIEYEYDGQGKITQVYLNNELYSRYKYNDFGKICEVSVFANGKEPFETEYLYDAYGFVTAEVSRIGDEQIEKQNIKYKHGTNSTQIKVYQGKNLLCTYDYDNLGRLVKVLGSDGYTKQISYSKGGRILTEEDSNGVKIEYKYNTNGTWRVEETKNGTKRNVFEYDTDGNLVKKTNTLDGNTVYEYDGFGRLVCVQNKKGSLRYSYDERGRKTGEVVFEKNGNRVYDKKVEYDDKKRCRTEYEGNVITQIEYTDAWNRVIKRISALGEYLYDYDWAGNIVKITGPDGIVQTFDYSAAGKVVKSESEKGEKYWQWNAYGNLVSVKQNQKELYKAEYDDLGRLIKETNLMGNEHEYGYGEDGKINFVQSYDTGKKEIKLRTDGKISVLDNNGSEILYELGKNGRVEREIDSENNQTFYKYDINGRLTEKTFGTGLISTVTYVQSENKKEICYSNGEKLEVWENALGQITKIQSGDVADEFEYDLGGRLVLEKNNVIQSFVKYEYDDFGRCVQKSGDEFEVLYEYDKLGRVCKLLDRFSGAEVCYEYDKNGNVITECYSNGVTVNREYNDLNKPVRIYTKNRVGVELWNQSIEYDDKYRVKKIIQSDGKEWEYEYDSKGRLVKCVNPYSGKEEYEYTENGSVSCVCSENQKIVYEYDKMNRVGSLHNSAESEKSSLQWDKNGSLVCITTPNQKVFFRYGSQLRPTEVEVHNLQNGSVSYIYYTYDALGRRVSQTVNGVKTVYVYDGLTYNVLFNTVVTDSGRVLSKEKAQKEKVEGEIKWIDTDDFLENGAGRGVARTENAEWEDKFSARVTSEFGSWNSSVRPKRVVYFGEVPVFAIYSNGYETMGTEVEFLVKDYKGNVAVTFDGEGNCLEQGVNDLWGNEIEYSRNGSYGRGVRHTEIPGLMFIDMGARDYVPALKCFTTQDSLRDGGNWFAYCACDPLNYVDQNGYYKTDATEEEKADYAAEVAKIGMFDKEEYKETGKSVGIRSELDCADVSSEIDHIASKETGIETTSERQKTFNDDMEKGEISKAKNDVQAINFYTDEESYKKTGDKEDLSDPDIVTVGSVLVFGDDPATEKSESHTVTITAVDYDESGNVIGVSYIEGHTGGGKTETGYMDLKHLNGWGFVNGVFTIEAWKGVFKGVFEIEGAGNDVTSTETAGSESLEGGCEK